MFRRYELVLGFLLGVAVSAVVAAVYNQYQNQGTQPNQTTQRHSARLGAEERLADYTWWLGLFTFVLSVSTIGLWIVTWRSGVRQSRDMQQSIAAAVRLAETSERALTDLERPHVHPRFEPVQFRDPDSGGQFSVSRPVRYAFVNHGRTPTFLTELCHRLSVHQKPRLPPPVDPNDANAGFRMPEGVVVGPNGESRMFQLYLLSSLSENALFMFQNRRGELFIDGYVRYRDIFGNRYITGFCAIYDRETTQLVLLGGEQHNYARAEKNEG